MLHKKKVNRGFTLVELLAVIVILAIILGIAVPKIMSVITDSKKSSLETSAKMIASAAEKMKTQKEISGEEIPTTLNCSDIAKVSSDYEMCVVVFSGNTAKVNITGSGKFKGLYIYNATKNSATATTEKITTNSISDSIKTLYNNNAEENGLVKDNTVDENIRYSGTNENVKNYVVFKSNALSYNNNGIMQISCAVEDPACNGVENPSTSEQEIWRIIGVFKVKTSGGKIEELVKLVKEEPIGKLPWDNSLDNNGYGINQWGESTYLDGSIYKGSYLKQYLNNELEDSYAINTEFSNMIETVVWNTGAIDYRWMTGEQSDLVQTDSSFSYFDVPTSNWYNAERGSLNGKICTEGDSCNDTVVRTTSWTGKIALPYITDFAYASSEDGCRSNLAEVIGDNFDTSNMSCKKNNWMTSSNESDMEWMLSPAAFNSEAGNVTFVISSGVSSMTSAKSSFYVRPTVYLKSNIFIQSGTGSQNDPYVLSIQ